ncbi:semaphorin-1A-like [Varroa jacobsoni]|uniref:semaphorin-1A-like n=1 Tax=Varroa jacobsoni TaxID=62625 RepID=UPI000BF8D05A|nr:semaphorin-1A-like [Varroa jacobsoni]XP_022703346.1 semaphorin-1A-like [Varroa jacobsoni]XP_022703347.1 semaphorin-1A-like [Varroa jacobsoni]XP_022703348.1 semaphorin-1A-like [Varroa jacobsoni]
MDRTAAITTTRPSCPSRTSSYSILLLFFVAQVLRNEAAWQDNIQPKLRINTLPVDRVVRFRSEQENDHFRLLDHDGDFLLIGAKNMVYNVSAATLSVRRRLEWRPSDSDVKMCILKGKSEAACHNYIRVIAKKAHDRVLVCGTNAYKPRCRDYALLPSGPPPSGSSASDHKGKNQRSPDREFSLTDEKPGEGLCPYDPNHNSTFTFADGDLYAGTVGQFSGADPLIYRKPLRTEQFDLKHLNAPQFVSSMHLGGFVYFFFRESAVEYINCGKAVYSRVARVCTNDQGGPHKFKERFTSFLKARLNCSIPGDMPFYFNELQSTSPIVEGSYRGERARLIYSVLTTGANSISGSAVCAFRLDDIDTAFHGSFKGQEDKNSNWLPVINSKVPEPRPGQCVNNSKSLPDVTLNFITNHPLMDQAVPAYLGRPVVVHTGFSYRYTYIAVDPQVEAVSGKMYDVLFIGTDHGHVLKVINIASLTEAASDNSHTAEPVIVEDVYVFGRPGDPGPSSGSGGSSSAAHSGPVAVTNLVVQRSPYEQKLIVVSNSEIQGVPLFHCQRAQNCGDCVRLQDPYCAWSLDERKCTHNWRRDRHSSVQSIEHGWDERCGANSRPHPNSGAIVDDPRSSSSPDLPGLDHHPDGPNVIPGTFFTSANVYSVETLAIAITTSIVTSLVVGFISGYIFARRWKNDIDVDSGPEDYTRYVDINRMGGLMGPDLGVGYGGGHYEPTYALPPGMNVGGPRPINLVLNKNGKPTNHLSNHPSANLANSPMAMNNIGTLDNNKTTTLQKVKKIYL